jgi:hypothetical protein
MSVMVVIEASFSIPMGFLHDGELMGCSGSVMLIVTLIVIDKRLR